ncbi:MAG: hypothetical protein AAB649_00030 [Patescibacteria group bacterium]
MPSEKASKVVVTILDELAGLPERFTFDAGSTHQTLLWDNTTVIIRHDRNPDNKGLPQNGLSVVVDDPKTSALVAASMLKRAGFTSIVHDNLMPEVGNKVVLVESDAFEGWVLVFRLHVLAMGEPPNKRMLAGDE